jgi:transcriptional regulator with XRE-family HTH domain
MPSVVQEPDERASFRERLGANLGRYRRAAGVTQRTIADALGLNVGTIGRWEDGKGAPDVWELSVMIERYGVPCAWLLDPTGDVNTLRRRSEQLRRAAREAAQADAEDGRGQPGGDDSEAQPGTGPS